MSLRENWEAELQELRDRETDLTHMMDECKSKIEDLEYDIEQLEDDEDDGIEADDNRQRAADMNATLRDIGSTRL